MRNLKPAIFVLLATLPLAAQTDPAKPASLAGTVKDSQTGAPVPRAHVTMGRYGTSAAADGKFLISGVPPGSYPLTAIKARYAAPRRRSVVALQAGEAKTDFEIRLTPTGAIVGRITDSDREPVESAIVEAEANGNVVDSRPTDEHGMFRLGGLAPGRYRVKASHSRLFGGKPEIRTDGTVEHHDANTYYPGVIAEEAAGAIIVRPGLESPGVDIQLIRFPFVHVIGRVVGIPRAAENAVVTVWERTGGSGMGVGNDGAFDFWPPAPGTYGLTGEWNAPNGEQVETARLEIEVADSNIENIELRVVPRSKIEGNVEYEDASAKAMATKYVNGVKVRLFQISADSGNLESEDVTAHGTFELRSVPAGKYWLGVAEDKLYVKSMRLGSMSIDGAILDLSNGSAGADLTLVLRAAAGVVTGVVQDDKGNAAGTEVVLVAAGMETGFEPRHATTNAVGVYVFSNLPPGSYKLVATGEGDPATQGNHVLGYEDQMDSATVGAGEKVTRDLKRRVPE